MKKVKGRMIPIFKTTTVLAADVSQGFHSIEIPLGPNTRILSVDMNSKNEACHGLVALKFAYLPTGANTIRIGNEAFLEENLGFVWLFKLPSPGHTGVTINVIYRPPLTADNIMATEILLFEEDEDNVD